MSTPQAISFADAQARVETLIEGWTAASARLQQRVQSAAFRTATAPQQTKVMVSGSLLMTLEKPIKLLADALNSLTPAAAGSDLFADITAEGADEALAAQGLKKEAVIASAQQSVDRLLPSFEALLKEAEAGLTTEA